MAITFFGSASTPADGGTAAVDPTSVIPPVSMVAGDLVLMYAHAKVGSLTLAISETSGQTWTTETGFGNANASARMFWCRFNGTWGTDPSVSFGSTTNNSVRMLVFRPTAGSNTWAIDVAQATATYTAPATPFTVTRTGVTTVADGAVVVAWWTSQDDNTWDTLTGGWTALTPAQVRNIAGTDTSMTHAWLVKSPAGATGNVSQNQATLGGDAGLTQIIAFKETAAAGGSLIYRPGMAQSLLVQ